MQIKSSQVPQKTSVKETPPIQGLFFRDFKNSYFTEILDEIYAKKVYDPYTIGRTDMIIADWGANQGLTSHYFKDFAKVVYAVEPAAIHQEVIEKMLETNNIMTVKLCKYAISNKNGTTKFYHNENVTMFSLSDAVNNKNDYEEVETVTPEEFFKREKIDHIDLLKWDTEGNESDILASESFAKVAPKIKVIVGEWHQWTQMPKDMFANTFIDLGFDFKWNHQTHASVFIAVRL